MNDQHPHAGYVGDDAYATGSFTTHTTSENGYDDGGGYQTAAYGTGSYAAGTYDPASYATGAHQTADPLYGGYDAGHSGQYDTAQWSDTTASTTSAYTAYADPAATSGQWDAATWSQEQGDRQQYPAATAPTYGTTGEWYGQGTGGDAYATGSWDTTGTAGTADTTGSFDTAAYAPASYETGAYDAAAWNHATEETGATAAFVPEQYDYSPADDGPRAEQAEPAAEADGDTGTAFGAGPDAEADGAPADPAGDFTEDLPDDLDGDGPSTQTFEVLDDLGGPDDRERADDTDAVDAFDEPVAVAASARTARRAGGSRGRRRTPARRSALLTVAVPSACVMGVAGIAAASVSGLTGTEQKDDGKAVTAADPASVKPAVANSALDTQLAALDAEALDFGDRASRTQERIDLKARQEAERKKREEEAKRREAMRPKFALPVALRQLSAGYGQSGVNWMSLHTGIDFPVQYGTPVMAATDGTVRTQWNGAYGNMVIVTAKDGTETWYCHLSSAKIRSGSVKAGEVIAYSGNSGNSTGPHLHFEVRPGGGAAIDPEAWLRSHGLSPTG
ncbi:M23 family metallopeptidase [Streptomyces fradiae]|uniref:M23 family metallopeptidase n=1 Tax=Streptomyces fradiae TaxID=1906 RepID=UPI003986C12E